MCIYISLFSNSLNNALPLQLQLYRWDERTLRPVWTHREALDRLFGHFCLLGAYAWNMMITKIQLLRYRWDRGLWSSQRPWIMCLGTFVFWGLVYACKDMIRYIRWHFIDLPVLAPRMTVPREYVIALHVWALGTTRLFP